MENYQIYDEIGKGKFSSVYKARHKKSIQYVAVKSTQKNRMAKVLNEVQLLHNLDHGNILKFHNWYESKNHIWLIFEYCTGGDLLKLVTQDKQLPETMLQLFGRDIVCGLHYLHCRGIVFRDIKPANILIDEYGQLKLADFGLARNLPMKMEQVKQSGQASPQYMAPELFENGIYSYASDFWALGCILFEMSTGNPPFVHDTFTTLANMIEVENVDFSKLDDTTSVLYKDLLCKLLEKDPRKRITWPELLCHEFWNGHLSHVQHTDLPQQVLFEQQFPQTLNNMDKVENASTRKLAFQEQPNVEVTQVAPLENNSVHEDVHINQENLLNHEKSDSEDELFQITNQHVHHVDETGNVVARPVSAPANHNVPLQNMISKQQINHQVPPKTAPHDDNTRKNSAFHQAVPHVDSITNHFRMGGMCDLTAWNLLFTSSFDRTTASIVCNKSIDDVQRPRYVSDILPEACVPPVELTKSSGKVLEHILASLYKFLLSNSPVPQILNTLCYIQVVGTTSKLANILINCSIMIPLIKLLRKGVVSVKVSVLETIGILIRYATYIAPEKDTIHKQSDGHSLIKVLTLLLCDPNNKIRRRSAAALGELLFYISTKTPSAKDPSWNVPGSAIVSFLGCLDGDDVVLQHYVVQTLANIFVQSKATEIIDRLLSDYLLQTLCGIFLENEANVELRIASIVAILHLCRHAAERKVLSMFFEKIPADVVNDMVNITTKYLLTGKKDQFHSSLTLLLIIVATPPGEVCAPPLLQQTRALMLKQYGLAKTLTNLATPTSSSSHTTPAKSMVTLYWIFRNVQFAPGNDTLAFVATCMQLNLMKRITKLLASQEQYYNSAHMIFCLRHLCIQIVYLVTTIASEMATPQFQDLLQNATSESDCQYIELMLSCFSSINYVFSHPCLRKDLKKHLQKAEFTNAGAFLHSIGMLVELATKVNKFEFQDFILQAVQSLTLHALDIALEDEEMAFTILYPAMAKILESQSSELRVLGLQLVCKILDFHSNSKVQNQKSELLSNTFLTQHILPRLKPVLCAKGMEAHLCLKLLSIAASQHSSMVGTFYKLGLVSSIFDMLNVLKVNGKGEGNSVQSQLSPHCTALVKHIVEANQLPLHVLYECKIAYYLVPALFHAISNQIHSCAGHLLDASYALLFTLSAIIRRDTKEKNDASRLDVEGLTKLNSPLLAVAQILMYILDTGYGAKEVFDLRELAIEDNEHSMVDLASRCLLLLGQIHGGMFYGNFCVNRELENQLNPLSVCYRALQGSNEQVGLRLLRILSSGLKSNSGFDCSREIMSHEDLWNAIQLQSRSPNPSSKSAVIVAKQICNRVEELYHTPFSDT